MIQTVGHLAQPMTAVELARNTQPPPQPPPAEPQDSVLITASRSVLAAGVTGLVLSAAGPYLMLGLAYGMASMGAAGPAFVLLAAAEGLHNARFVLGGISAVTTAVSGGILIGHKLSQKDNPQQGSPPTP